MREIKFRQFIGGTFYYWGIGIDGAVFVGPGSGGGERIDTTPHSQYTGLKDTNGKEIYEGDLLNIVIDFGYGPQGVIAKVVWKDSGWQFDSDAGCEYGADGVGEVIGNIYENPELLEDT